MGTTVLRSPHPFLHVDSFGSRTPQPPMKPSRRRALRSGAASSSTPALQTRLRRQPASFPPQARSGRPCPRAGGRRLAFADKENGASNAMVVRFPTHNLVMEKVKILKRGVDPAPPVAPQPADNRRPDAAGEAGFSPLFSTGRLGPEPEILPKQIVFTDPLLASSPLAPRCADESHASSTALKEIQPKQIAVDRRSGGGVPGKDKVTRKQISFSVPSPVAYAGPAYINSPSPSSVPFPSSLMSKAGPDEAAKRASHELATRNLRLGDEP